MKAVRSIQQWVLESNLKLSQFAFLNSSIKRRRKVLFYFDKVNSIIYDSLSLKLQEVVMQNTEAILQDRELASKIASGDVYAFEDLYKRDHGRVYAICFRMTKNKSVAEDLTQDIFIQVWKKIYTYKGGSQLSTWIFRLAVNEVLMHFRKKYVRQEKDSLEDNTPEINIAKSRGYNDPDNLTMLELLKAISSLAPGYKSALILKDVYGFQEQEAADILGCSKGTIKSQVHKARIKVREYLIEKAI